MQYPRSHVHLPADGGGAGVLLGVGGSPTPELVEVREGRVAVVVGVPANKSSVQLINVHSIVDATTAVISCKLIDSPQRQVVPADEGGVPEDGLPLGGGRVDAASHSIRCTAVHQGLTSIFTIYANIIHETAKKTLTPAAHPHPNLVGRSVAGPVLRTLDVQPHASRPLVEAVPLQMRHQLAHLGISALTASRAY